MPSTTTTTAANTANSAQAHRGLLYATEIVEIGWEEALEKARTAAREKEEKSAKGKIEMEELAKKKRAKGEAKKEEARKRKESRKAAAARRRQFQADIKADYDISMATSTADDKA